MNELELETRLQRELKRVAGETRGPAPLAAQARYRRAEAPMAVISKLAVGLAAATIAFSGGVVAAAAVGGSSPTAVAQAVKQAVQHCQNDPSQSGVGGVTECVSSLVPSNPLLPPPSITGPGSSGANPGPRTPAGARASGRAQTRSGPSTIATGTPSQGLSPSAAAKGVSGSTAQASPSPAGTSAPAGVAAPSPSAVAIPTPSSTPPTPTPTPTAAGSGPGVDPGPPGPSPSPPAPSPAPSPALKP